MSVRAIQTALLNLPHMSQSRHLRALLYWSLLLGMLAGGFGVPALGQDLPGSPVARWQEPVLPRNLGALLNQPAPDLALSPPAWRIPLFRMPTGYPSDSLSLEPDTAPDDPGSAGDRDTGSDGRLQVYMGNDNPYFDFRRPGDPGGIGYYRLQSQFQLLDNQKSGVSMVLQAVTPAGIEADGVSSGPTFISPHVAWFQELGGGTAIQGFVGKDVRANSEWSSGLHRSVRYGLAVQCPVPAAENLPGQGMHMFIEALGRYHYDALTPGTAQPNLELLPGLHWRMAENWWVSGGLLVPLGAPRPENKLWQFTCSWQF
jgi:hypothetical protein